MTNAKGVLEWMEWEKKRKANMTNEEYIRSCSTEELTTLLCALVDTGILNAWTIMYHCADSDSDAVRIWLQKTYEGNKE